MLEWKTVAIAFYILGLVQAVIFVHDQPGKMRWWGYITLVLWPIGVPLGVILGTVEFIRERRTYG